MTDLIFSLALQTHCFLGHYSKVSKISDARSAHSVMSSGVVKRVSKARIALSENNFLTCNLDSRPVVVFNVETSINTRAPMNVLIKAILPASNAVFCHPH